MKFINIEVLHFTFESALLLLMGLLTFAIGESALRLSPLRRLGIALH